MKVSEIMTDRIECLAPEDSLRMAAQKMVELDSGFIPVCQADSEKLVGVITDRDIVVRAVAEGLDPDMNPVRNLMTDIPEFCYADDEVETATGMMSRQGIYRLVVMDNAQDRNLCGVLSLGDVMRHDRKDLAARTASDISKLAA